MNAKPGRFLPALAAVALVLTACYSEPPPPPTNSAPVIVPGKPGEEASTIPPGKAGPVEETPPNDADVKFVQDMVFHHQQALDMAKLAPNRASSRDVKGIADRIADVQGAEIGMMNRWLRDHDLAEVNPTTPGGHGHGGDPDMPGMATQDQLDALEGTTGDKFDTMFLQLMIAHHKGALTMAQEVQTAGVDVQVQNMADDVIVEQSDEINLMQRLLNS